jgi:hypothetical protein
MSCSPGNNFPQLGQYSCRSSLTHATLPSFVPIVSKAVIHSHLEHLINLESSIGPIVKFISSFLPFHYAPLHKSADQAPPFLKVYPGLGREIAVADRLPGCEVVKAEAVKKAADHSGNSQFSTTACQSISLISQSELPTENNLPKDA